MSDYSADNTVRKTLTLKISVFFEPRPPLLQHSLTQPSGWHVSSKYILITFLYENQIPVIYPEGLSKFYPSSFLTLVINFGYFHPFISNILYREVFFDNVVHAPYVIFLCILYNLFL